MPRGHSIITSRLFGNFYPLPPPCHRLSHPADPHNYVTFDQLSAPLTPVETTYRNVQLLSVYVNAVIFSFSPGFSVKFCMKLHKFSQWDRSVTSNYAPTSTHPTNSIASGWRVVVPTTNSPMS